MGVFAKVALTLPADKQAQFLQMLEHVLSKDLDQEFVAVLTKQLGIYNHVHVYMQRIKQLFLIYKQILLINSNIMKSLFENRTNALSFGYE